LSTRFRNLVGLNRSYAVLFLALLAVYAYVFPRWADWNQNSRLDLILALVDQHSVTIDLYVANTGDYAAFNGHYYSDKAPGMALLGAPVYAAYERLMPRFVTGRLQVATTGSQALGATLRHGGTGVESDKVSVFLALLVTAFVAGAVPAAALGVIFFWLARQLGLSRIAGLVATALYALATSALPYANTLVGHQTSAFLLFAAFAVVFAVRRGLLGRPWLLGAGFLLGYAAINEYQTVLIGGLVGLYALFTLRRPVEVAARLVVGALPALVLLIGYDWVAFGTILPVGYFHSALWSNVHQIGLISLTYPHLDALWGITFGSYRGLFFLSPYLLLALPGYAWLWRQPTRRPEFWVLVLAPVAFFLFNASSAMWEGGFAVGPRYLVPALPFLALAAGLGTARVWGSAVGQFVVTAPALWSVLAVWSETISGQSFPDYTADPLFAYSLPKLLAGDVARNAGMFLGLAGWKSLLPLIAIVALSIAYLYRQNRDLESDDDPSAAVPSGIDRRAKWVAS
jgi:hypothetical protein